MAEECRRLAYRPAAAEGIRRPADSRMQVYDRSEGMEESKHRRETVMVCVPATDQALSLVRRGAHLSERLQARFVVLHVIPSTRYPHSLPAQQAMELARELGAEVVVREATKVGDAIVAHAVEVNATQIVLGASTRSWLRELVRGSTTRDVLSQTRDLDVHIVQRAVRQ